MMKLNNNARTINRKPSPLAACLFAFACAMSLAANFTYAALADARVIRVTAADVERLPARESYVVDLRQRNVVYDLDGTARAIDWSRVVVREAARDVALTTYFRERFPGNSAQTPTRLVIGATGGIENVLNLKDAPDGGPGTEYKCGDVEGKNICACFGSSDCKQMFKAKVCKSDVGTCKLHDDDIVCACEEK